MVHVSEILDLKCLFHPGFFEFSPRVPLTGPKPSFNHSSSATNTTLVAMSSCHDTVESDSFKVGIRHKKRT